MEQNDLLAVAIICQNEDGDILLRRRTKDPDSNTWQIIAGYVNKGERVEDAVKRYLKDKANITEISKIEFTGKYYDDPNRHPGTHCIPLLFKASVPNSQIKTVKGASWFEQKFLPDLEYALDNKQMLLDVGIL